MACSRQSESYDAGRDASFYTFADLCISRQMYTAVQASRREKHAPLNSYISLYANLAENEQEENENADTGTCEQIDLRDGYQP